LLAFATWLPRADSPSIWHAHRLANAAQVKALPLWVWLGGVLGNLRRVAVNRRRPRLEAQPGFYRGGDRKEQLTASLLFDPIRRVSVSAFDPSQGKRWQVFAPDRGRGCTGDLENKRRAPDQIAPGEPEPFSCPGARGRIPLRRGSIIWLTRFR